MDALNEQAFVRRHLGTESNITDANANALTANEEEMAPNSPLLRQEATRSVKSFWGATSTPLPPPSFDAGAITPSKAASRISRPGRSKHRLGGVGDEISTPPRSSGADQTGQVTGVLQGLKARQEELELAHRRAPSSPDHESADIQSAPEPNARQAADADAADAAANPDAPAQQSMEAAPANAAQQPVAEGGLCSCCPCLDSICTSSSSHLLSGLSHFSSTLEGWLGLSGRDAAVSEIRLGVLLPQDATKPNVTSIEKCLARLPEAAVINVRVRRATELVADAIIAHPMVRMHVVDLRTGSYWRKQDKSRHAVAPYENLRQSGGPIESLLPIMTQPYGLKARGGFVPAWDENLLVNEPVRQILDPHALLLFELVDFGPAVDLNLHPTGYLPIAWAFLKPLNARGEPNIGVNQQLQFYRYTDLGAAQLHLLPSRASRTVHQLRKSGVTPVYYEWVWQKNAGRVRYPATLFVDFTGVAPPTLEKVRGFRPTLPTQIEEGRMEYDELRAMVAPVDEFAGLDATTAEGRRARKKAVEQMTPLERAALVRRRTTTDPCQIPNKRVADIAAGLTGCFALRYSPDGRTLAAACGDGLMFTLKLFDSDTGAQVFTFTGHHDLIYDLSWNAVGTQIVTASSDGTAKVWAVDATRSLAPHQQRPNAIAILQHTGFVYACAFHTKLADIDVVFTGGFDGALRVWNTRGELLHVVRDAHASRINSIVLAPNGTRIFTADADGIVKVWEDTNYTRATGAMETLDKKDGPSTAWSSRLRCLHTISHDQMRGVSINCIRYHARPERLVVYGRNNCIYVIGLLRYDVRHVLAGVPCHHHALRCAISPDGDMLVAGGEDGQAYFFDLAHRGGGSSGGVGGNELLKVLEVGFHAPLYDIAWHPTQHAVAFASFGGDYPIRVYEYNAATAAAAAAAAAAMSDTRGTADERTTTLGASSQRQLQPALRTGVRDSQLPPLHGGTSTALPISTGKPLAYSQRRAPSNAATSSSALLAPPAESGTDRLGASKRVHFSRE